MPRKKKEEIQKETKPKAIGPYDIIKMMFTDNAAFNNLSKIVLERNFFMINRIMSIQFPLQAQCFNQLNISQAQVVKAWSQFAVSKFGYGRVPSFVYTKGSKASAAMKDTDDISKELKEAYCKHYNLSNADYKDIISMYHDMTVNHIKNFEELYKSINQIIKNQ